MKKYIRTLFFVLVTILYTYIPSQAIGYPHSLIGHKKVSKKATSAIVLKNTNSLIRLLIFSNLK